jgi:hypothetical protein
MARKLALIIGNSQYEDTGLAKLAAPDVDVRALAEVLQTPGIGAFDEVTPLLNEGLATVRKSIARFFDAKHRDDLLFLYFSGHGIRDEQGHLYLAVRDTERAVLAGTAIEASYVTARMDRSASKRLVLVLDCCHSGAFGYGAKAAQGAAVGTATAFEGTGRGRVVLTATDSTQYAWEGDQVLGEVETSLFTHYMIEGLRTGAADRDEDGLITIDELYDYVYDHVLNETPKQTPGKWAFGQQGEIVIAHNAAASRTKLPPEIEEAVRSALPSVRLEAVRELDNILRGRHAGRSNAAREMLKRLAEDDSRRVAAAAVEILKAFELGGRPVQPETLAREIEIEKQKEVEQTARIETARMQAARVEAERIEAERVEAERVEAARVEAARVEAARVEAERVQAERVQAERAARAAAVAEQLVAAEVALTRGALDDARERLDKALEIEPQHAGALKLVAALQERIEERTRLEDAERRIRELRQKIGTLIARANATDSHTEAIALLDEALGLDPEHAEVKELLEERHRLRAEAEAAERRAHSIATVQERIARHLERGELEDAEHALASAEALGAPAEVFAPLRERLAQLHDKRRRDAEEAIRLKAEAEKRARADQIARHLVSARKAIDQQRFDDALETLRQASALDPKATGISELVSNAEAGKAALEAEAKKRQEIENHLNEASRHLTKGHLTKAIVITDVLLGLDPNHPAAKLLHEQIQKAIEGQKEAERKAAQDRERQRQIEDMIATAEAAPTHDTAIEILNDVLGRDPGNARAGRLLDKRQAELDALRAEQRRSEIAAAQQTIEEHLRRHELDPAGAELDAAERRFQSTAEFRALRERLHEVRRKEELDRLARAAVEQAEEDFARGNHQRAIADLSKFRPQHDMVSAAIRALKAQAEEIRRAREEQEARARIEAERAAREERMARLIATAQAAVNQQRFQEALEAVEQLRALAPDVSGLDRLATAAADGLRAQRAAEEARRQAEIARQEMDKTLARAAKRHRRRDYTAALGLIDEVLARESQHPAALSLRAEVQRAIEEEAKHPVKGFSIRPTLSSATVWIRTKAIHSNTFRIAGGLVLAAAVAVGVWRGPADAPPSVESGPAAKPATTSNPTPTGSPVSVTPATKGAVDGVDVGPMVAEARKHLGGGDLVAAARALVPALAKAQDNAEVLKTRDEILGAAESRANTAKQVTDSAGTPKPSEYDAANKRLQSAVTARRSGRPEDVEPAVREYLSAAELYRTALPSNVDVDSLAGSATALVKQGNYPEAARVIVDGLKLAPGDARLLGTLQQALAAAKESADRAKRAADSSGASSQREYVDAGARFKSAVSAGSSDRSEDKASAVGHYVAATRGYIEAVNRQAQRVLKQGNLVAAARAVTAGLGAAPGNANLLKTLQEVLSGAEAAANATKIAADKSGASSRPEYSDAAARLSSAASLPRSSSPEDAQSAIREYLAAADLYATAVNRNAQAVLRQGNLVGAARAIGVGLEATPGNADFQKTLQEILETAEGAAEAAKRSADSAGASDRSNYVNATSHFASAVGYRRSGSPADAEAAVREYSTAEKMYRDAAVAAPPPPPPPVGVGPIVNNAKGLIAQGNLSGAARAIVGGLKDNPKNSELTGTILQLYRAAEAEATNARSAADAAGAKDRPEYADANARLQTARYSSRTAGPENAESIVLEFGAAADLYRAAAARVKTDPRALDELAIRKLLADYAEAYNTMDVRRVRRFKPSFTEFPRDLSSTELTISDIRIVLTPDRQTASVTLAAQYKNTYRKGAVPSAIAPPALRLTWRVQRKGDVWILE